MSNSLSNYHIRHNNSDAVERVARNVLGGEAYLSRVWGSWISLYDAKTNQDAAELHRVAGLLSAGLGCPVWAFLIHDSTVLAYIVYDQGSLRDEYSSKPDHFGPVGESRKLRLAGQAEVVKQYAEPKVSLEEVRRFLGGSFTLGAQEDQFKDRIRQTIKSTTPESIGQMLNLASQHLSKLPPEILKETLGKAGMPMNNPIVAAMMANPAAFLQQLSSNPEALNAMVQQVSSLSESSLEATMDESMSNLPAEVRLLELAKMLGINPKRACLSYAALQKGEADDSEQFRLITPQ
jgi:hypothetical protein